MSYTNGILTVPSFDATVNPGEFTFTGATYTNQADNLGQGTAALAVGFILFVQASDTNTFLQIPGRSHRYRITSLTIVDASTIDATVLWDEAGAIEDAPTNGVDCVISSVSTDHKYGFPVDPAIYSTLSAGLISGMMNVETSDITDALGNVGTINGKDGEVVFAAGAGIDIDASGPTIVLTSTGADEGIYQ